MTDKTDLIREILEYVTTHGGENTATHLLVQAASAIQTQAAELEAVGAGGVQALSAAPNGWESVIDEARSGLQDSEPSAFDNSGYRAFAETVLAAVEEGLSALAASPTPQALSAEPAVDITTAGEMQAFEAWYKQDCVIEGAAAKMAAKAAWEARAMLEASPTPPAEQQARYSRLHDADALHGKQLSVYGTATTTEAALGGVYAELPRAGAIGYASVVDVDSYVTRMTIGPRLPGVRDIALWTTDQLRDFADRTHALRMQAAPKAAPGEPVHGDVLPPVGSRVYIRHGRDNDAHACTVTGYYAWGDLGGDKRLHRVFVQLVYEGTDRQQARMLCDCYPTAEAALAQAAPQQEAQEPTTIDQKTMELAESVGLIGPASRIGDLHAAIQRFHDLICVNATIKAAVMAADVISGVATPARDYPPLPMQFACSGVFPVYSADQMRAYVDADRAAYAPGSSQPAPAPLSDDTERLREALQRIEGASMSMYATRSDMLEHCQDIARAALAAQGEKDAG